MERYVSKKATPDASGMMAAPGVDSSCLRGGGDHLSEIGRVTNTKGRHRRPFVFQRPGL